MSRMLQDVLVEFQLVPLGDGDSVRDNSDTKAKPSRAITCIGLERLVAA
jgi:hypothetical protein